MSFFFSSLSERFLTFDRNPPGSIQFRATPTRLQHRVPVDLLSVPFRIPGNSRPVGHRVPSRFVLCSIQSLRRRTFGFAFMANLCIWQKSLISKSPVVQHVLRVLPIQSSSFDQHWRQAPVEELDILFWLWGEKARPSQLLCACFLQHLASVWS